MVRELGPKSKDFEFKFQSKLTLDTHCENKLLAQFLAATPSNLEGLLNRIAKFGSRKG